MGFNAMEGIFTILFVGIFVLVAITFVVVLVMAVRNQSSARRAMDAMSARLEGLEAREAAREQRAPGYPGPSTSPGRHDAAGHPDFPGPEGPTRV